MISDYNISHTPLEDYSLLIKERPIRRMDYVGFTFNGIHSSQMNILRVSDGSRYSENLLPTLEDYSIDIVGGIGSNYFGGTYKKTDININIAFDEVEEPQLRAMRALFGEREVHELYFDECPYKVYNAVISRTPTIKYIAFGDVGTRVYKGEGSITFTLYDPVGYSKNGNYLDDYEWENIEEWNIASGMLNNKYITNSEGVREKYYDTPIAESDKIIIHAYNAGLLPTPFKMYLQWTGNSLEIKNNTTNKFLKLNRTAVNNDPIYENDDPIYGANDASISILIDTERSLAIQVDSNRNEKIDNKTWVLNHLVEDGRFFTLQPGINELEISGASFNPLIVDSTEKDNGFIFYHRFL